MDLQRVESLEFYDRIPTEEIANEESQIQQMCCHINKKMFRFKMHYFLLTGGLGLIHPFLAVIARDRLKLSASSFASVLVFEQFLFVCTKPAIGYITDYFNKLKTVLCIIAIGQVLFFFILLLLPPIPDGTDGEPFSETHNLTACNLCENSRMDENKLKIFENTTGGSEARSLLYIAQKIEKKSKIFKNSIGNSESKGLFYLPIFSKDTCSLLRNQYSKISQNFSSKMSFDCKLKANSFIYHLHKDAIRLQSNETENNSTISSNSLHFKTFECPHTLTNSNSCAALLNNCVLCFNSEESHYYSVNASNSDEISRRKTDFETYQFWVFALVFITLDTCINVIFTLSDTACCENMGKKGADYGKQRLWGSFAWGLLAPVGGAITDFTGDYIVTGILFAVLSTIMIWNILKMDLRKPQFSKDILKKVGTVMKEKEFLCFELGVFVNGIGLVFIWFYLMWFIISIGGNRLICGLTQTVQSFLGEIPFMFFSGWMLKRLGYWNVMMLSLLAYCVRFLWYSQLHSPWMALPIDWTHGVTYGVFYASLATYAKVKSKRGTETTMQAVIAATHDGLGAGIGNIIAGVGFDYIGAQKTFLYTGICFGCCAIISLCAALLQKKKNAANAEI
ncbi:uncharacterized protein LOC129966723 [Argiope bruennichi]|uniref:uncharacterized protein LOC129966723 n=1 Tax=Argiope bruennichi TaxID=94029 RepID=UPI0024952EC1|nr:uncharacterized protein LOC129966723 [Argiope bruennichi]XP_055937233.1 uncharacterized protein LOC129966723 [Argiope bruennichi]